MRETQNIVVREFEHLTASKTSKPGYHRLTHKQFDALRLFLLENHGDEDEPLELMRLGAVPGVGEVIQARNYVGVIELDDGLQIEILPKIDLSAEALTNEESARQQRAIFIRMLAALGADMSFKSLENAHLATARLPLMELFIAMFLDECTKLVASGLRSSYEKAREISTVVRGRIDFNRMAKMNPAHAEHLPVVYSKFTRNRPENRLVKRTLLYLKRTTRDESNWRSVSRLLPAFDDIVPSTNIDADFARCVDSRETKAYATLLSWCRVFLKGESFSTFRGSSISTALLFPMERIFEDYVGKTLRREALASGRLRRVDLQAQTKWLFNENRVKLRPDILCERHDGRLIVLDTKWKRVNGPQDLSTADMHQMYAYGQRYRCDNERLQHVVLLYPWHRDKDCDLEPGILPGGQHVSRDGVQVDMFFIDLGNMYTSLEKLLGWTEAL